MTAAGSTVRIVVAVAMPDLGEATRALELARGLRENPPGGWRVEIGFLSHGGAFADRVRDAGFEVHEARPRFAGVSFREDLGSHEPEFIGSPELAHDLIRGEFAVLSRLRPDVVLHGFWPPAAIACRMLGIPTACFISVPLHPDSLGAANFLRDLPDSLVPLTYLPHAVRRRLAARIPRRIVLAAPMLPQRNIRLGAERAGWRGVPLRRIWDMLHADLTVVNDLPDFYRGVPLPEGFRLTGPLFAPAESGAEVDPRIAELFAPTERRPKVLCAMGSSPGKEHLLEAVEALTTGPARDWNSVILVPPAICPLDEVRERAGTAGRVLITDAFVPAPPVNALADVLVSHGGQGTVQTAITGGTPVVGFGIQMEQQLNLDHLVDAGAALRLPIHRWRARNIQRAVGRVLADPGYREGAGRLRRRFLETDGRRDAAAAIWEWIVRTRPGAPGDAGPAGPPARTGNCLPES